MQQQQKQKPEAANDSRDYLRQYPKSTLTLNPADHRCNEFGGAILHLEHLAEEKRLAVAEKQTEQQDRS